MQPGRQFSQPALFDAVSAPSSAVAQRNRLVPIGGQLELPLHEDVLAGRREPAPPMVSPQRRLLAGEHPVDVFHAGTFPMFMTGPEIRNQFQALDADRYGGENWGDPHHVTVRATRLASRDKRALVNTSGGSFGVQYDSFNRGDTIPSLRRAVEDLPETDQNLYDRKYDEASHMEHASNDDGEVHGAGLLDRVHQHGFDWSYPVSLATGLGGNESGRRGDFGKYQVLGGHHRVAVMSTDFPRQFVPIQWHHTIDDAKRSQSY